MKKIAYFMFAALLSAATINGARAQAQTKPTKAQKKAAEEEVVKKAVEGKRYVFVAQYAIPQGGGSRYIQSNYDLKVTADTVVSFLPYFGRAFTAPINPSEGGIKFTATQYDYDAKVNDKGFWNIVISPKDVRDVRMMRLNISPSGYGTLYVNSNNRTPITFNGYITEIKDDKKK